jgi:hypothetical protein
MNRNEMLHAAKELINGQRAEDYGDAFENHARIGKIWEALTGDSFPPEKVAMMMIGMKLSRIAHTSTHPDTWVDICGYGALGGEMAFRSAQNEGRR